MAASKSTQPDGQDADVEGAAEKQPAKAPGLRYLVTYPRVGVMVDGEQVVVEKGQYLDEHVPHEVAAAKGPELITFGMAAAVAQ